jgi:hypothetical protein
MWCQYASFESVLLPHKCILLCPIMALEISIRRRSARLAARPCGLLDAELLDLLLHQATVLKVVDATQASVGFGWAGQSLPWREHSIA